MNDARPELPDAERLQTWLGQHVVVDTLGLQIYIGVLSGLDAAFFQLDDADVHDVRDSRDTKEQYIHNTRKLGHSANRRSVLIYKHQVVSLSRLDDIIRF